MRKAQLVPLTLAFGMSLVGCDWNSKDDYNAKKEYQAFLKKQEQAKADQSKDAAHGGGVAVVAEVPGKKTYETYCVACHGLDGKADGAAALAMNPKPRNFTDKAWQGKVSDEHIEKVIKDGGAAVGLSATMAPWGAVVQGDELKALVLYVRHFGK